jgi:hypothetical protein
VEGEAVDDFVPITEPGTRRIPCRRSRSRIFGASHASRDGGVLF